MNKLETALEGNLWHIHADLQITRRKRFYVVTDPQGKIQWRARTLAAASAWLDENEQTAYILHAGPDEAARFLCTRL